MEADLYSGRVSTWRRGCQPACSQTRGNGGQQPAHAMGNMSHLSRSGLSSQMQARPAPKVASAHFGSTLCSDEDSRPKIRAVVFGILRLRLSLSRFWFASVIAMWMCLKAGEPQTSWGSFGFPFEANPNRMPLKKETSMYFKLRTAGLQRWTPSLAADASFNSSTTQGINVLIINGIQFLAPNNTRAFFRILKPIS